MIQTWEYHQHRILGLHWRQCFESRDGCRGCTDSRFLKWRAKINLLTIFYLPLLRQKLKLEFEESSVRRKGYVNRWWKNITINYLAGPVTFRGNPRFRDMKEHTVRGVNRAFNIYGGENAGAKVTRISREHGPIELYGTIIIIFLNIRCDNIISKDKI